MSKDRESVPVSLPPELVDRLDALVEEGIFRSRSDALQHGARLVLREQQARYLHDHAEHRAREDVEQRLGRKRTS